MVKRRGYRVELGEIEVGLMRNPDIREAAVVAIPDPDSGVRDRGVRELRGRPHADDHRAQEDRVAGLPPYMIPDSFSVVEALPRTSTNKVDLQTLKARA